MLTLITDGNQTQFYKRIFHVVINFTEALLNCAGRRNKTKTPQVLLPESSSMISVHIVRDEELSTPDHWVCDNQVPARVCRNKNMCVLNIYLHYKDDKG